MPTETFTFKDGELLQRYFGQGDESAFAELVRRHGAMVHATTRRVAPQDAEDATQAAFFLLAKRAARLQNRDSVASWLYLTARLCASTARRTRQRHDHHIHKAREASMQTSSSSGPEEILGSELLDTAIASLPENQRQVLLLRFVESLSVAEVAQRLSLSNDVVAKRSSRAVERLRDFFRRRGIAIPAGAIMAALPAQTAPIIPQVISAQARKIASTAGHATVLAAAKVAATVLVLGAASIAIKVAYNSIPAAPAPAPAALPQPAALRPPAPSASFQIVSTPLTKEQANQRAKDFLVSLGAADEVKLADFIIADTPAAQHAAAQKLIADYTHGYYARFPQRLSVGSFATMMASQDNVLISATFDANSPIDADVRHLQFLMVPSGGRWMIKETAFTAGEADNIGPAENLTGKGKAPNVKYEKAMAAWQALQNLFESGGEIDGRDVKISQLPATIDICRKAPDAIDAFVNSFEGTGVEMKREDVEQIKDQIRKMGEAAANPDQKKAIADLDRMGTDTASMSVMQKLEEAGQKITKLAEAAAEAKHDSPRPASFSPEVSLVLSWNQATYALHGPLKFPEWLRESPAFKQWQIRRDIRSFRTQDDDNKIYEVFCMGAARRADGSEYPLINSIRQYRPDGTLAAMASFDANVMQAYSWAELDTTGTQYTVQVSASPDYDGKLPKINRVVFYDRQGNERIWQVDGNTVMSEDQADPIGTIKSTVRKPSRKRSAGDHAASR